MPDYTVILSGTRREAMEFIRQHDLPLSSTFWPSTAGHFKGRKVTRIIELPSFAKSPLRHSLRAAMRYLKVDIEKAETFHEDQTTIFDQLDTGENEIAPEANGQVKPNPLDYFLDNFTEEA